jgi:hypothetical protein
MLSLPCPVALPAAFQRLIEIVEWTTALGHVELSFYRMTAVFRLCFSSHSNRRHCLNHWGPNEASKIYIHYKRSRRQVVSRPLHLIKSQSSTHSNSLQGSVFLYTFHLPSSYPPRCTSTVSAMSPSFSLSSTSHAGS